MRSWIVVAFCVSAFGATGLWADDLAWGGTYIANWNNFGTGPYTASDTSLKGSPTIHLFCLDFNDSIAPPFNWQANITTLNSVDVSSTAQYGGSYNTQIDAAYAADAKNGTLPKGETLGQVQVATTPLAFTGDQSASAGQYKVDLSQSSSAYTRYLEAAWLFKNIQSALPGDQETAIIAQVAAWELFVNNAQTDYTNQKESNFAYLTQLVDTYGCSSTCANTFGFGNYLNLPTNTDYLNNRTVGTKFTSGLTFEQAVDVALAAAQNAVVAEGWGPGSNDYGSWNIVTATPDYVVGENQAPVQEFLSYDATPNLFPTPEPAAIVVFGTMLLLALYVQKRERAKIS